MSGFPNPSYGTVITAPASSGHNVIQPTGPAVVPLTVKGAAAQSANLQEWQNSAGTVLDYVNAAGEFHTSIISNVADNGPYASFGATALSLINRVGVGNIPLIVKGMAGQTGNLQQWSDSAGTVLAQIQPTGQGRFASLGVANSLAATVAVGTLARKIEVFDQAGASLGFVPVYTTIT